MFWNQEPPQARGPSFRNMLALAPKGNRSFVVLKTPHDLRCACSGEKSLSRGRVSLIENLERSIRQNMGD